MAQEDSQYLKNLPATYRGICDHAAAAIDQAGIAAAAEAAADPTCLDQFRKLLLTIQEQYPYYIFALHKIDIRRGLPNENADYDDAAISDQCSVMMEFCNSERLVRLVRNFDPTQGTSQYPFFAYLQYTLRKECEKLQSEQYDQDLHHSITNHYDKGTATISKQISKHLRELLALKSDITPRDCAAIAEYLKIPVEQVERFRQIQAQTTGVMELDRWIGEDEDDDTQLFELTENPNAPSPDQILVNQTAAPDQRWQRLEQVFLEVLTPKQQQVYSYCVTAKLIDSEMNKLIVQYRSLGSNQRINSVPTLFQAVPDIALQHLTSLKEEYTQRGIKLIELSLFDLAISKRVVPTQGDIAQILQVSEQNISKQQKAAEKKINERLLPDA